jgi:hypothetical protein
MSHIVVVSAAEGDLSARMTDTRTRLDHHKSELDAFRYTPDAKGVVFHVEFEFEIKAKAFAQPFGVGRLGNRKPKSCQGCQRRSEYASAAGVKLHHGRM